MKENGSGSKSQLVYVKFTCMDFCDRRSEAISDCYASIVIERMVVMYLKGNNVSFNFLKGSSHKHKRNEKQKSGINVMVATNSVSLSCIRNY